MKVALKKNLADSEEIDGELHVDCREKNEWLLRGGQMKRAQNKE